MTIDVATLKEQLTTQLGRLPIFPLGGVCLFPNAMLPLYVFEPRYREMTAACLERGGGMAVALLLPGFEDDYEGRPAVAQIAGAGQVVAHRKNPDGTYHILLHGLMRIRIEEELPPVRLFREVRATLLPDLLRTDEGGGAALVASAQVLRALTEQLATTLPKGGDALLALCHDAESPSALCDALAAALVASPQRRQMLLETSDVAERIEQVTTELAQLLHQRAPRGTLH